MDISDKIKQLIADGKTLDALEQLQKFFKNKDQNLLNQTYLLESQYKEIQQKISLGLQDASTELNRINFTLLSLCDDLKNLTTKKVEEEEITNDDTISDSAAINKTGIIFGILVVIVLIVLFLLVKYL